MSSPIMNDSKTRGIRFSQRRALISKILPWSRVTRAREEEESDRHATPNVSDRRRGVVFFQRRLVFCRAYASFRSEFSYLEDWQDLWIGGTLTRIKKEPGADDSQRSSFPLGKNQPLQYQGVAATAVSREIRQRRCGPWTKKRKKKIKR